MAVAAASHALRQGVAAHKSGNLDAAEQFYLSIVSSHPNHPDTTSEINVIAKAYSYLGVAQQHRGDLAAAIDSYKQAVRLKPDFTEVYYLMGHALRNKGALKASIACYQQAAKMNPGDANAFNHLGAAQQHNGELDAAVNSYKQAVKISPTFVEAYNNLGSALQAKGDLDDAIDSFKHALRLKPDYANAYNNMGNALHDKGDLEGSLDCYKSALNIMPDSAQAHNNMGNTLRDAGRYEEAIEHFDYLTESETNPNKPQFWFNAKSQALECLYILGRYSELEERLNLLSDAGDINLRIAAVSAFITHQLKIDDPYPFCKKPLDFIHTGNLSDHVADVNGFAYDLIAEATKENQMWEPKHGVTKLGFQSSPTIFNAGKHCDALEDVLRKEIESYFSKFQSEDCAYMNLWPSAYDLRGWFVRLIKNGYQKPHNHPSGWLSGVVYLQTVDTEDTDEGAIELSLHGHDLPILDSNYPRKIHRPKKGDIILFPSSVFHRTIPFSKDTERCVIAFDLYRYSH